MTESMFLLSVAGRTDQYVGRVSEVSSACVCVHMLISVPVPYLDTTQRVAARDFKLARSFLPYCFPALELSVPGEWLAMASSARLESLQGIRWARQQLLRHVSAVLIYLQPRIGADL